MEFSKKERTEADGGDVTSGKPIDMKATEYNRLQGSDGFSKNGGHGNGFGS